MKFVRGRADARWFPSRHHFALFRLAAFVRLKHARPEPGDVMLVVDQHQSATETWLVMCWLLLTLACYLAATLFAGWYLPIALGTALPLAFVLLEVPAILSALTVAPFAQNGIRVNGIVVMLLFTAAAAYFAARPTWVRFVGWQFLALLVLNAIAAVIVFALRNTIARLEGGIASAP